MPTDAFQAFTMAIYGLQRQMGELALRVAAVEGGPSGSAPPLPSLGMPGYGRLPLLPASGPVISEILTSQPVPPTLQMTTQAAPHSATASQPVPPTHPFPITQISFPHSPSLVPSLSSIMHVGSVSSPTVMHEPPRRIHVPPEAAGAGVPRYHKLSFPTYDGKDPLGWLNRCERFFHGQLSHEADKVWLASFHMTGTDQQ